MVTDIQVEPCLWVTYQIGPDYWSPAHFVVDESTFWCCQPVWMNRSRKMAGAGWAEEVPSERFWQKQKEQPPQSERCSICDARVQDAIERGLLEVKPDGSIGFTERGRREWWIELKWVDEWGDPSMIAVATDRVPGPSSADSKILSWVHCTCCEMSAWPPPTSAVVSLGRKHRFDGKPCGKTKQKRS